MINARISRFISFLTKCITSNMVCYNLTVHLEPRSWRVANSSPMSERSMRLRATSNGLASAKLLAYVRDFALSHPHGGGLRDGIIIVQDAVRYDGNLCRYEVDVRFSGPSGAQIQDEAIPAFRRSLQKKVHDNLVLTLAINSSGRPLTDYLRIMIPIRLTEDCYVQKRTNGACVLEMARATFETPFFVPPTPMLMKNGTRGPLIT